MFNFNFLDSKPFKPSSFGYIPTPLKGAPVEEVRDKNKPLYEIGKTENGQTTLTLRGEGSYSTLIMSSVQCSNLFEC